MATFTQYNSAVNTPVDLAAYTLAGGINIAGASYTGADSQASFFSGFEYGITSGVLLSSGDGAPPLTNTSSSYTEAIFGPGDTGLSAIVATLPAGSTETHDAAILELSFQTVTPSLGVQFTLLFGSDEYPEFQDTDFIDIAAVYVDGVNYANFNGSATAPLSVLSGNLPYFVDNTSGVVPIEYDGISHPLTIVAPLDTSLNTHTLRIAVADTGDWAYDSAILFTGLTTTAANSGGVKHTLTATEGDDALVGDAQDDFILLLGGNDWFHAGAGNDHAKGNLGNDTIYGGQGFDDLFGSKGDDVLQGNKNGDTIQGGEGNDFVAGGGGLDRLQGGANDDTLAGGLGADTLIGGGGNDQLSGGDGADQFWFFNASGDDTVTDFVHGTDLIGVLAGVNGGAIDTPTELLAAAADDGFGNATIDLGGGASVLLLGVSEAALTESDFFML